MLKARAFAAKDPFERVRGTGRTERGVGQQPKVMAHAFAHRKEQQREQDPTGCVASAGREAHHRGDPIAFPCPNAP